MFRILSFVLHLAIGHMCACVCPDIYVSVSMYIICMCIQTHKAEQALLVYTATESLSHNSQLLMLAQSVGLSCSVKSGLKIFVLFVFTFRDKL